MLFLAVISGENERWELDVFVLRGGPIYLAMIQFRYRNMMNMKYVWNFIPDMII